MQKFFKLLSLVLAFTSLSFGLQSCGGGGGSSSSSPTSSTTPITSSKQAVHVASQADFFDLVDESYQKSVTTSSETYKNSSAFSKVVSHVLNAVKKASFNADMLNTRSINSVNKTDACEYGGTTTYSGTYDNSTGNMDIKVQDDKCNDDNNDVYSDIFYIKGKYIDDNNFNLTITPDFGSEKWVYEGANYSDREIFRDFKLTGKSTNTGEEFTANGIVTYDLNPESACEGLSGTYEYRTIAPVEYDKTSNQLVSGDVKVNDNTEIKWDNGIVHIYYNGTEVYQGNEDELSNVCPALPDD